VAAVQFRFRVFYRSSPTVTESWRYVCAFFVRRFTHERKPGKMRAEGKTYTVKDGDVLHFPVQQLATCVACGCRTEASQA
jgi:ribosome-binding ATPase YchF (GTP1/OBG family)